MEKAKKYGENVIKMKYQFTPFVLEAQGAWGDQAKKFFNSVLSDYAEAAGADLGVLKHYWTARIAIALQVGVQTKIITGSAHGHGHVISNGCG